MIQGHGPGLDERSIGPQRGATTASPSTSWSIVGTMRTNIELDDELIARAVALYGTRSKEETVYLALRRLVGAALTTEEALTLQGTGWDADLDALRDDLPPESE